MSRPTLRPGVDFPPRLLDFAPGLDVLGRNPFSVPNEAASLMSRWSMQAQTQWRRTAS
jgi:hypothetical protein